MIFPSYSPSYTIPYILPLPLVPTPRGDLFYLSILCFWKEDFLFIFLKISIQAGVCQWLTPVILATQEAEIRRIIVWSQPGKIVCKTLSQKKPITKKGWWSGSRCRPWVQTPV
jgi:hypothetical protein